MSNNQKLFEFREKLISDAIALREPARIPFIPLIGMYPLIEYGSSVKQAMYEPKESNKAFIRFYEEFQPDWAASNPVLHSGKQMDILQPTYLKWPGAAIDPLPDNSCFQFIEDNMPMEETDYNEFINNTGQWILGKYYPKAFKAMSSLKDFSISTVAINGPHNYLGKLVSKEGIAALRTFAESCNVAAEYWQAFNELISQLNHMGFPSMLGNALEVPYDLLGDNARGTIGIMTDLIDQPDNVLAAILKIAEDTKKEIAMFAAKNPVCKRVFFFMHKGMDGFMSNRQYETFYWRPLMDVVDTCVKYGLTPVLQCQGGYNTRLEFLKELPKGKCLVLFEKIDLANARKALQGITCICGNFPVADLINSKKEEVITLTKRIIDDYAGGGGFMMSNNASIDDANRENLEAFFNTCLTYGKK